MEPMKQVVGIDVSKDTFDAAVGTINEQQDIHWVADATFANDRRGAHRLVRWLEKVADPGAVWFVMEATGVYYEHLAYFLHEHGRQVVVVLPNKIAHFAKSLEMKSKTDRLDAWIIAQYGLSRSLQLWQPPSEQFRRLKELVREHTSIQQLLVKTQNHLHAKQHAHVANHSTIARLQAQAGLFEHQLASIETEIRSLVDQDTDLKGRIDHIVSIQGVGFMTAVTVTCETNGFAMINSAKQLASYAGLDIALRQSGKHTGRSSISKRGNRFIRSALYMPALTASRCNPQLKVFYQRLVDRKANKKLALVAVARKLLCLIYTLWKTNTDYNPNYRVA